MLISTLELNLYTKLQSYFEDYGFELLAEKKQFRKKTSYGFRNVIFTLTNYGEELWLEVNIGVRHHEIEKLAQQFLSNSKDFWEDTNTLIISIGKYNDAKYFRFKILNDEDLDITCKAVKDFLTNQGFAFLKKSESIKAINQVLNKEYHLPCKYVYNQIHRCFKGLIASKMASDNNFWDISEHYRNQVMKLGGTDEEVMAYERLLSYLLYWSVN